MRFSVVGIIVGAIVALIVYAVGVAITQFENEGLIWGLIALLIWAAIAFSGRFDDRRL
jgi:Na+-driven multidrug efflux pump